MDRDYIWEGEYGRRSHLIPVFQQLLREQDASSLQMLSLFVNNNPYNLEFFIAVSYDRPKEEHLDRMFRLLEDAGLRQRKDLTALNIMRAIADRRFNSASLLDEDRPEIRTSGSGIGVRNVHRRIRLTFGDRYGLTIFSEPDEGTTVRIRLPALDQDGAAQYQREDVP